jgi:hypothetical protein
MVTLRHLIMTLLVAGMFTAPIRAQAPDSPFRIDPARFVLQQPPPVAAQMHPAGKGAMIGAAAGAGTWGAIGLWYCTIGPSEAGECEPQRWTRGFVVYAAAGAAIGALIGALK